MKIFRIITIIFLAVSLVACGGIKTQRPEQYNQAKVAAKEKGAVFLNVSEGPRSFALTYHLKKLDSEDEVPYLISASNSFFGFVTEFNYAGHPIMLDPGYYYIDYVTLQTHVDGAYETQRWLPSPGIVNNFIKYGMFKVEAGKVISLGDLNIPSNLEHGRITNTDKVALIKEQLEYKDKDVNAQYLKKEVKRGKIYMPGSLISRKKNGEIQIISPERVAQLQRQYAEKLAELEE